MLIVFCVTSLCIASDTESLPHDINGAQFLYGELCNYALQSHVDLNEVRSVIKGCMNDFEDLFGTHVWHLHSEMAIQVTMLDLALISLCYQEKILTNVLGRCNEVSGYESAYFQYEREKMLADVLREYGVEQQLADVEIANVADLMIEAMFLQVNELVKMCKED